MSEMRQWRVGIGADQLGADLKSALLGARIDTSSKMVVSKRSRAPARSLRQSGNRNYGELSMRPMIGTSLKMNLTASETEVYLRALVSLVDDLHHCDLFVLPPFTSLWVARRELSGTSILWGGQDVHPDPAGAHTGDISAAMLVDLGCSYAEVGHSERRRDHGERDPQTARKVVSAIASGLQVVLCVGEERLTALPVARGVVCRHLSLILGDLTPAQLSQVVVAYEPHWAIGVGATAAPPNYVSAIHSAIHSWLARRGSPDGRVIYGGSVDAENCAAILKQPGVDGLFIGRAALDPAVFSRIAHAAVAGKLRTSLSGRAGGRGMAEKEDHENRDWC